MLSSTATSLYSRCCQACLLLLLAFVSQVLTDERIQVAVHDGRYVVGFTACGSEAKGTQVKTGVPQQGKLANK